MSLFGLVLILLACQEPSLLPAAPAPVTPPVSITPSASLTTSPAATTVSLTGKLRQVITTDGAGNQTTTYTYDLKTGPAQGLLLTYTTLSGPPASTTTTVVRLERSSVLLTGITETVTTGGRSQTATQFLSYEPGNDRNHVSQIIGTTGSGQQYYHTYTYDSQGRLVRWQRDVVAGVPKLDLAASLTWQGSNVSQVRETWADGNAEETGYQSDNLPNGTRQFLLDQGLPPGYAPGGLSQNNPVYATGQFSGQRLKYEYTVNPQNQPAQRRISRYQDGNWVLWQTDSYAYY